MGLEARIRSTTDLKRRSSWLSIPISKSCTGAFLWRRRGCHHLIIRPYAVFFPHGLLQIVGTDLSLSPRSD